MTRLLFNRAHNIATRLFGPQQSRPGPRRPARVRLTLEALEERALLSAPGIEPVAAPGVLLGSAHGLSPAGSPGQPSGFSPQQIAQAYGFNRIAFNGGTVKGDGTGQTIAIVDAFNQPHLAADLQAFDSEYGLPAPSSFRVLNQAGGSALPPANVAWGFEESLDVEWAHAMAPGAKLVLVEASAATWADLMTAANFARNLPGVSVVSLSWDSGEFSGETAFDSFFTTPAGHTGVTFVASSGDSGSSSLSYPSTSPAVLAVGGTQLTTDAAGDYLGETGWAGSGGGVSALEAQPSYQSGVVTQNGTSRAAPDVAYNGSRNSMYAVYDTSGYGGWVTGYGTSAGAPQWAALVAIADQGRALAGAGTLDGATQTLPAIYEMPADNFHDVTTGGNGAYSAGPGYDLVTGRGAPVADLVVNSLVFWGAAGRQVDLSGAFNRPDAVVTDGTSFSPSAGIDLAGHALSSNLLGPSLTWNGLGFTFGPANASNGVAALDQTLPLPQGYYSSLSFLATNYSASQAGLSFTVHYADGTSQALPLSFSNWAAPQNYSGESVVQAMPYVAKYDGSSLAGAHYLYGYSLPLNGGKQVASVTLPDQGGLDVLAMTLAPAPSQQEVSLGGWYNRAGIVADGATFGGGLDGGGHALSASQLGASVGWAGFGFGLGPAGAADAVSAVGQTVSLPGGAYAALAFLADGVNGNQAGLTFTVHYADGTSQAFSQSVSDWAAPQGYPGESRAVAMSYRDNANGTRDVRALYAYGYRVALAPGELVQSVTLPNDPNLEILAMTLVQAQPQQQVSLGGWYNRAGIVADGATFGGGLDGGGHALSASQLGQSVGWAGFGFGLGPAGAADAVSAAGQTVSLPGGAYAALAFLADGVNGNQAGLTFTVHYADGTSQAFSQSVSDWAAPQGYPGESRAAAMSYRDNANGTRDVRALYAYGYRVALAPGELVQSVTLPNDPNLEILAMTLT